MKVTLITVGKIKEKFFQDAIAEYSKRLSRYCKLEIVQVADEKTPEWSESILKMRTKMRLAKKTSQIEMKGTIIGSNSAKRSSCVIFSITLEKRKQGSERKVTKRTRSCEAV